ncbi:hypothetical protein L2E82_02714 [Cichorium intybus]|uniref:Uncharacterized protein n=1 Tax=Cichorium intybus TaxID=13427 RepID=A0ACB9H237_CICIN|nr:hypothetical protein L2E82_02714 [Cichorium intybus]
MATARNGNPPCERAGAGAGAGAGENYDSAKGTPCAFGHFEISLRSDSLRLESETQLLTEHRDERDGTKPPFPSSPSPLTRREASTPSRTLKEHGDETDNFHDAILSSRVLENQIDSCAELANYAYKGSTETRFRAVQ